MTSNSPLNMTPYQCDRVVHAGKIRLIEEMTDGDYCIKYTDISGHDSWVAVSFQFVEKFAPQAGGYLVRHTDGYLSYSPAAAFLAGYKTVNETTQG